MDTVMTTTAPLSNRTRLLAALLASGFTLASMATALPARATTRGDGLRAAANDERAKKDVAPVAGTRLLDDISDARADQMRDRKKLEHDMDYVRDRLVRSGVCWTSFGEIIAWRSGGDYSYNATVEQWMNSDPHRHILMSEDFNAAGGSWATASDGGHYSVMVFAKLCSSELRSGPSLLRPTDEYSPNRRMAFRAHEHRGYRLDSDGKVLSSKRIDLKDGKYAETTGRTKVDGDAYLKVTTGPLEGYWVRESKWRFVRGMVGKHEFDSARQVSVEADTYGLRRFDRMGRVTSREKKTFGSDAKLKVKAWAVINGRRYFKVAGGQLDDYWLRDTSAVDRLW